MHSEPKKTCSRCLIDSSDPDLLLDSVGICQYCRRDENFRKNQGSLEERAARLNQIVDQIKREKKGKYDSLLGLSGGVDSSYVALVAKRLGLNPLLIHFDNGWNSETAVRNIKKIADKCGFDLETFVIDWDEFRDLQRAFFKASVLDIELLTDHAIMATLYRISRKSGIKKVLSGNNWATENGMPPQWSWNKRDYQNIKSIHRSFGEGKLKTFPVLPTWKWVLIQKFGMGMEFIEILNLIDYRKDRALEELKREFDYVYYGGKHYESVFTKFYQAHYLPEKFGIDKRKAHFSSLIRNGEITREEGIKLMRAPLYEENDLWLDREFVLKKLGFSEEDFQTVLKTPPKAHWEYSNELGFLRTGRVIKNFLSGGQRGRTILYITYDGVMEPLGRSQVLGYLEKLAQRGNKILLLSFEKKADLCDFGKLYDLERKLELHGIHWIRLKYHKRPTVLATSYDVLRGIIVSAFLVLRKKVRIVHARSYVPALMSLFLKRLFRIEFVFDMRGFWADERVEGQVGELWTRKSWLYRLVKRLERAFLLNADHVVSLTHSGVREMKKFPYLKETRLPKFEVIPTCADLERFRRSSREGLRGQPFTLGYVGSVDHWYLFDPAIRLFQLLKKRRPDARWVILNRGQQAWIQNQLESAGVEMRDVEIREAPHSEIPQEMQKMTATAFFIKPVFSKKASAPTKLAEFLACGVPCLTNSGVGDLDRLIEDERVGALTRGFEDVDLEEALDRFLTLLEDPELSDRCEGVAHKHFSLDEGVERYQEVYEASFPASQA